MRFSKPTILVSGLAVFTLWPATLSSAAQWAEKIEERLPQDDPALQPEMDSEPTVIISVSQPSDDAPNSDIDKRLPVIDNAPAQEDGTVQVEPRPLREGPAVSFVLTAVQIRGATAIPAEEFAPLYDDLLARSISLSDVTKLVDRITALYREKGYFLSRAVAPAQSGANGILRIDVAEGYLADISIDGDASADVKRRFDKLRDERPLRLATLERTMALVGDMRGISVVSSRIEPDPMQLAPHRLVVTLKSDRFDASFYTDNRGTNDAGPIQTSVKLAVNSIVRTGDQLSGGLFFIPDSPGELMLGEVSYQFPLTEAGTYAAFTGRISHFDAGASLAALDTESRAKKLAFTISHPLIRRRKESLVGSIGFEGRDIEEEQLSASRYNDKVRILSGSLNYRKSHLNGITSIYGSVTKGLNVFGASTGGVSLSRPDADSEFTKFNTQISRYQNIGKTFGLYVSFSGQTSLDPLLASEEFSVGGARYGRAYNYGELTGDDGIAILGELRYGRNPGVSYLKFYQLYGFVDHGIVWNDNVSPAFESLSLSSAGGGLRLTFPEDIYATFELARPLDRTPYTQNDRDWRGFFSISKSF